MNTNETTLLVVGILGTVIQWALRGPKGVPGWLAWVAVAIAAGT